MTWHGMQNRAKSSFTLCLVENNVFSLQEAVVKSNGERTWREDSKNLL